ncbi:MAG TPA: HVO_0476 family zinc finger protein [Thermoplasmata archaeon]|nr:HVO_0476 family zinc finger protein [Thermoplasmata archaeon]
MGPGVSEVSEAAAGASGRGAVGRARLRCDFCGRDTDHRILRLNARRRAGDLEGVARCAVCRSTHPFLQPSPRLRDVAGVLSEGGRSRTVRWSLSEGAELVVDAPLPGPDPTLRVRRIDLRDGRRPHRATAGEVATIWVSRESPTLLRLALVEGRRTIPLEVDLTDGSLVGVGNLLSVNGRSLRVHALRAHGQTWEEGGREFRPVEIDRAYVHVELPRGPERARRRRDPQDRTTWDRARPPMRPGPRTIRRAPRSRPR